jgi:hypothetical protein
MSPTPYPRIAELDELLDWLPEERRRTVLHEWVLEQYTDGEEGNEESQS